MKFLEFMQNNVVVLDGAMGTELQKRGLETGALPERLNVGAPETVEAVHRAYVDAGAKVISANTFGANRIKVGSSEEAVSLVRAGIAAARRAAGGRAYVALDIGPTGALAEPLGDMTFEEAYDVFREQAEACADAADLAIIETMSDLTELKAAALAVRENTSLPVLCSMTFDENGRTFTGCSVETFALTASPYCDAIGINCSLGPAQILPLMRRLKKYTRKPLFVKANAGLPDSRMNYSVTAEEFVSACLPYLEEGIFILGGCCGTTPEYIKRLSNAVAGVVKKQDNGRRVPSAVCSATKAVDIDGVKVIGERINPTGKKAMKKALTEGDFGYIASQALEQIEAGAEILDVNAGLPEIDEKTVLVKTVKFLQSLTDAPLQIDCGKPDAIESALRCYTGKAIVNSVSAEDGALRGILPVAAKYGAAVVGLTVGADGVPATTERRLELARKIIETAKEYGIPEEDVYIDCLTLTVSAEQSQAMQTLAALTQIKKEYRVKTVLGVSNVSFGLPARRIVNTAFLTAAMYAGLDLPILNPNDAANMQAVDAFNVLNGKDVGCAAFIEKYADYKPAESAKRASSAEKATISGDPDDLTYCISKGLDRAAAITAALLERYDGMTVVNDMLIPALNKVGDDFERGVIFLPQLIASAETAKACFDAVKRSMPESADTSKGEIVLATVKGDVHDIGKNIVGTVLENYGYRITDLGKNVDPEEVVRVCAARKIRLCGLSALMTTTAENMRVTVRRLRESCPDCRIMVGGAVLTPEYAAEIGADVYCRDAAASARYAAEVFGG